MHREVFGGLVGGAIKKDKLFYFGSYQGTRANDQLLATSVVAVPPDLTGDRSAAERYREPSLFTQLERPD